MPHRAQQALTSNVVRDTQAQGKRSDTPGFPRVRAGRANLNPKLQYSRVFSLMFRKTEAKITR